MLGRVGGVCCDLDADFSRADAAVAAADFDVFKLCLVNKSLILQDMIGAGMDVA